jgi:hypothetical protein
VAREELGAADSVDSSCFPPRGLPWSFWRMWVLTRAMKSSRRPAEM